MISIDYKDKRPIYDQVYGNLKNLILLKVLKPDEKLPSVRSLAIELSINPNTIQKAYAMLEQDGYIYSVQGKGNFVSGEIDISQVKRDDLTHTINILISQANNYNIDKKTLIKLIEDAYKEEEHND